MGKRLARLIPGDEGAEGVYRSVGFEGVVWQAV